MVKIPNIRSENSQETTAILVSRKAWSELINRLEMPYYMYKDDFQHKQLTSLNYEEKLLHHDQVINDPFFFTPFGNKTEKAKVYSRFGITNAVFDVFIILHKLCNTNGIIRDITTNYLYRVYSSYKEQNAAISSQQFYVAMEKLMTAGMIEVTKDAYGRKTIQLNFILDENNKPYSYVPISPVVFTHEFNKLSIAAKKLFLDIALQQGEGDRPFVERMLKSTDSNGRPAANGGLYKFLHRNYPHQIRDVMKELTKPLECLNGQPLMTICDFPSKEKRSRRYTKLLLCVNKPLRTKQENVTHYRDTIEYRSTYKRKAQIIINELNELMIGEFAVDINHFVKVLKRAGTRQIKQVLRDFKDSIKGEGFPSGMQIEYRLMKLLPKSKNYIVLDLAHKEGIYDLITQSVIQGNEKQAIQQFAVNLSLDSLLKLKSIFRKGYTYLKENYLQPITEELYHKKNPIRFREQNIFRHYAFERGVDLESYRLLEVKLYEWMREEGYEEFDTVPSHLRENMMESIDALPEGPLRCIVLPDHFNMYRYIRLLIDGQQNDTALSIAATA
ncbi:hypothetical protein [Bacillus cereus]|uniref:hypothetical protein n=1 Tax=Bacillus cereus TaxID=1396 RepID=UPI0018794625|nr:hypothetical protein [Bacillus cereus]MBE7123119.1 hypothetical protein [Bacillus cereus]